MLFLKTKGILIIICLLIAAIPFPAMAKNYRINPQFSAIHEDFGLLYPPDPSESFSIEGAFTFAVEENYVGNIIRLKAFNIKPTALPGGPFVFPAYYLVMFNGSSFLGSSDPCYFGVEHGTCYSIGNFGGISGTISGDEIIIEGEAPIDRWKSYYFTIKATTKEAGDIDGNGHVNLADAILALQTLSFITPPVTIYNEASVNTNLEISPVEPIYIMQKMAGIR